MVTEEEWSILKENFSVDQEIFVTKSREDSDFILETEPPVCDECVLQREKQEEDKQLVYRNVTVYVRRLTGSEKFPEKDNSDPDYDMFSKMNGNSSKRMKMSNGHCVTNGSCSAADFVRRSNRRQKVRGEREFTVSSTTLLRDLKVKVKNFSFLSENCEFSLVICLTLLCSLNNYQFIKFIFENSA
mgnify:CR=1 FL=1